MENTQRKRRGEKERGERGRERTTISYIHIKYA